MKKPQNPWNNRACSASSYIPEKNIESHLSTYLFLFECGVCSAQSETESEGIKSVHYIGKMCDIKLNMLIVNFPTTPTKKPILNPLTDLQALLPFHD